MRHRDRVLAGVLFVLSIARLLSAEPSPHLRQIRPMDAETRRLLAIGREKSRTFRDLVRRIEAADVIAYVHMSVPRSRFHAGFLTVIENPAMPVVRIALSRALSSRRLVGVLAHELQHVLEVVEAGVRDARSLRALYHRIGVRGADHTFDSIAAQEAGRVVSEELRRQRDAGDAWPQGVS